MCQALFQAVELQQQRETSKHAHPRRTLKDESGPKRHHLDRCEILKRKTLHLEAQNIMK